MTNDIKSEFTDLREMDRNVLFATFGELSPDLTGLVGYYRDQVECPEGYEKRYMFEIARDGAEIAWFLPIYDSKSAMLRLGLFRGIVTNCHKWQSDSHYVRFEHDGAIRTFKVNHWAFVPVAPKKSDKERMWDALDQIAAEHAHLDELDEEPLEF